MSKKISENRLALRDDIIIKPGLCIIFKECPQEFDKIDEFYMILTIIRNTISMFTNELANITYDNIYTSDSKILLHKLLRNIMNILLKNKTFLITNFKHISIDLIQNTIDELKSFENFHNFPKSYKISVHRHWMKIWDELRTPDIKSIEYKKKHEEEISEGWTTVYNNLDYNNIDYNEIKGKVTFSVSEITETVCKGVNEFTNYFHQIIYI